MATCCIKMNTKRMHSVVGLKKKTMSISQWHVIGQDRLPIPCTYCVFLVAVKMQSTSNILP